MSCKLFDIAAFAPLSKRNVVVGWNAERDPPASVTESFMKGARRRLRESTFLDATSILDAWKSWHDRSSEPFVGFVKCRPPWPVCFVFSGSLEGFEVGFTVATLGNDECKRIFEESSHSNEQTETIRSQVDYVVVITKWYTRSLSGRPIACATWPHFAAFFNASGAFVGFSEGADNVNAWAYTLPFFAFQLLNCRNIETRESVYVPRLPKGIRNKAPKIAYHTLAISDAIVKRDGQGPSGEHPGVAKHVVRGNFAHYTDDNKLFGKYTGMFWRPMHIRGEAKHGIVGKEYVMVEPTA